MSCFPCSLVVTWWGKADLLALLCVMLTCVFVTFPYGFMGQEWHLIISIPDLCLLSYFVCYRMMANVISAQYFSQRTYGDPIVYL